MFPRAWWSKVRCSNAGIAENPWTLNAREFRPGFTFRTCPIFWSTEASKHAWWPGLTHVKVRALMVFLPYFSLFDLSHLLWILNIFKHSSIYLDCLNVATDFYTFESGRVDPESTIAINTPIVAICSEHYCNLEHRHVNGFVTGKAATYWCWLQFHRFQENIVQWKKNEKARESWCSWEERKKKLGQREDRRLNDETKKLSSQFWPNFIEFGNCHL